MSRSNFDPLQEYLQACPTAEKQANGFAHYFIGALSGVAKPADWRMAIKIAQDASADSDAREAARRRR